MNYKYTLFLLAVTALGLAACGKTTEQKAADATAERLEAQAKEVKADAAATADVIKKDAARDADATKKAGDVKAESLEKTAERVKAAPTTVPVAQ